LVSIIPTLGDDWSDEPSVFFMVILSEVLGSSEGRIGSPMKQDDREPFT
jgi:hypothetical protein